MRRYMRRCGDGSWRAGVFLLLCVLFLLPTRMSGRLTEKERIDCFPQRFWEGAESVIFFMLGMDEIDLVNYLSCERHRWF